MAAGFCLEFYVVDYATLRDGDPKSMQSMKKSMKIPIINLSPNFTIDTGNEFVLIKRGLVREHLKTALKR